MEGNKYLYILAVLLCALVPNAKAAPRTDPLVETNLGLIRGVRSTDGDYSMFMGIPYATVDDPFGPAIPQPVFDEVFDASQDSAICPQVEEFNNTIVGTLDCLQLNIYVPNTATSRNRLPVLVWIFGGGYTIGYAGRSLYGPNYLVRNDIIVVTVNYRLGPYGFMCLDTPEVPGNQGLKDQYLALKWIKNNIESFGGDSNKITISGQSAGGASVDLHMYYDKEDLFNQVIMQSGTALAVWAVQESRPTVPLRMAEYLGYFTSNVGEAMSFLSTVDPKLVIEASTELGMRFRPCIEKAFDGVEGFMTEHPLNTDVPRVKNIAVLIGHNDDESILDILSVDENVISDHLSEFFDFEENQRVELEKLVRRFYMGDEEINDQSMFLLADFNSDFLFSYHVQRSIQKYFKNGAKTIYQNVFSYNGGRNFMKSRLNVTVGGAAHADELSYVFAMDVLRDALSPADQLIIDRMSTLWANFVKLGNPTPETTELLPVIWEPVTEENAYYLNIDSEVSLGRRSFYARMAFWDLFYKMNYALETGYGNN